MWTRQYLVVACFLTAASVMLVACGDDERQTPDCRTTECFTSPDGGAPVNGTNKDGGTSSDADGGTD